MRFFKPQGDFLLDIREIKRYLDENLGKLPYDIPFSEHDLLYHATQILDSMLLVNLRPILTGMVTQVSIWFQTYVNIGIDPVYVNMFSEIFLFLVHQLQLSYVSLDFYDMSTGICKYEFVREAAGKLLFKLKESPHVSSIEDTQPFGVFDFSNVSF